jgi:hypothetical protein
MSFFDKLERKYGRYAVKGLMKYLIVLYAIGVFTSSVYVDRLSLDISRVMSGEVWRIFTWLIYSPSNGPIFAVIMIMLYYNLGNTLEYVWGSFRFNVYMFMGILFHIIAAFIMYYIFKQNILITPEELNISIFLAFAITFPEMEFRLYFVLPIKAKILALFYIGIEAFNFINGNVSTKLTIFLCVLNFIIFYLFTGKLQSKIKMSKKKKSWNSGNDITRMQARNRIHKCAVCGRTGEDNANLEFRYCSKCEGNYEYCNEHIFTHIHILGNNKED